MPTPQLDKTLSKEAELKNIILNALEYAILYYDEDEHDGKNRRPFCDFIYTAIVEESLAQIEQSAIKTTLDRVEDILPYSVGFTGRFYTLKQELLGENKE